jgi:beta-phosphoglucomutase
MAVIFDVDGVLVDSYDAHLLSWQMLAAETGTILDERDFAATFGQTSRDIIARFWSIHDPEQIQRLDDRKESLYRDIVSRDFPAMDGAVELIDALTAAGFRLAMGSSGPPENIELALDGLNRRAAFAAVVSGRDVRRGKPDPEVFLVAAKRLGIEPVRCVVIEDAPQGIQAARAACMGSVALLSRGRRRDDFTRLAPDLIVDSLRELSPQRLTELITRVHGRPAPSR